MDDAKEDAMKRIIVATALLLGTAIATQAHAAPQTMYKDLRPNGHKRSDAAYQADVDACYRRTGGNPDVPDSAAMKKCMLSNGYSFLWQRGFGGASRQASPADDPGSSSGPSVDSSPASTGPDTAGMNTPTNPTWSGLDQ